MSKRKLTLDDLRIESFITSFEEEAARTVNGGRGILTPIGIRDTAEPSRCDVACLPPKSEGCFSEAKGQCTELIGFN